MTATALDLTPGSEAWLKLMTASKVAAVLGLSKWDSPRSLWHKMRGDVPPEPQTKVQSRGHYLEPAVLAWFFDRHPELRRTADVGTVVHDNGWMACTPDAVGEFAEWGGLIPVEAKSDALDDEWGTPGTDEVPIYYAAQCMWTMHVLDAPRIWLPMIGPRLEFAEYVIDYDPAVGSAMEQKCRAFMDSLTGTTPPPVDSHRETLPTLRRLHPDVDRDGQVQLTTEQASLYVRSIHDQKAADAQTALAKATVAEAMGSARLAYHGDDLVCRRQGTSGPSAAIFPARTLPDIPTPEGSAAA
jgi:predicted phage-related endonuclease